MFVSKLAIQNTSGKYYELILLTKKFCVKCNREYSLNWFNHHKCTGFHFSNNCCFCDKEWSSRRSVIQHERRCRSNPDRIKIWNEGLTVKTNESVKTYTIKSRQSYKLNLSSRPNRIHSNETKAKISEARIKYLTEHPDQVPYKLNHSSKGRSYPERYFSLIFKEFNLIEEYKVGLYSLDFADIYNKIDVEIDGDQHYLDKRIISHDVKRNKNLKGLGWTIIRIRWSEYKKLDFIQRTEFINKLKIQMGR